MDEPKKDTVRISLPAGPEQAGADPSVEKRDAARIVLPTRTPVTPIRRLPPTITSMPAAEPAAETSTVFPRRPPMATPPSSSPLLQPLPKPPGIEGDAARPVPPDAGSSIAPSVNRG